MQLNKGHFDQEFESSRGCVPGCGRRGSQVVDCPHRVPVFGDPG